jgi:hypothetical protein
MRYWTVAARTAALVWAGAGSARAATTRYASPGGAGVDCAQAAPCRLGEARAGLVDGDTLQLAAGDYGTPGGNLSVPPIAQAVTVQGATGLVPSRLYVSNRRARRSSAISARATQRRGLRELEAQAARDEAEGAQGAIKVTRLPKGSYTLAVRVKTKDGRTVKSSKQYRTCSSP